MTIYVDIDETICNTPRGMVSWDYLNSKPRQNQIDKINKLYDDGNEIVYWTARGGATGVDWSDLTKEQLKQWGCKHTRIETQKKPSWDLCIDDKTKRIEEI